AAPGRRCHVSPTRVERPALPIPLSGRSLGWAVVRPASSPGQEAAERDHPPRAHLAAVPGRRCHVPPTRVKRPALPMPVAEKRKAPPVSRRRLGDGREASVHAGQNLYAAPNSTVRPYFWYS